MQWGPARESFPNPYSLRDLTAKLQEESSAIPPGLEHIHWVDIGDPLDQIGRF